MDKHPLINWHAPLRPARKPHLNKTGQVLADMHYGIHKDVSLHTVLSDNAIQHAAQLLRQINRA